MLAWNMTEVAGAVNAVHMMEEENEECTIRRGVFGSYEEDINGLRDPWC